MEIPSAAVHTSIPVARKVILVFAVLALLGAVQALARNVLAGSATGAGTPSVTVIRFTTALTRDTYPWRLAESIYTEAFSRLGCRFELYSFPVERALLEADAGRMDGDVARIRLEDDQADQYPNLIRVPEPVYQMKLVAYTIDPKLYFNGWADLGRKRLIVGHPRGYKATEKSIFEFVDRGHIIEVGSIPLGLEMLIHRRIDVLIAAQTAVEGELAAAEFKEKGIVPAGVIETVPLYPYMHQRHSALVPRLAEVLKAMKADGTYRRLDELARNRSR